MQIFVSTNWKRLTLLLLIIGLGLNVTCTNELIQSSPILSDLQIVPQNPVSYEVVNVSVKASDENGIVSVKIFYKIENESFHSIPMAPNQDLDIYSGQIPPYEAGQRIFLYIEATSKIGKKSTLPTNAPEALNNYSIEPSKILINEIYSGELLAKSSWIELINLSDNSIDLGGFKISDGKPIAESKVKFEIPTGTSIGGWGYLVLPRPNDNQNDLKIPSSGGAIWLKHSNDATIDQVNFPALESYQSYARATDNNRTWAQTSSTTPDAPNIIGSKIIVSTKVLARLPEALMESSGIISTSNGKIWTHNDAGNENKLYCINLSGTLTRTLTIGNATNVDWEDVAADSQNRIYIADVGNNNNDRKNQCFYRIDDPEPTSANSVQAEKISFAFEDQAAFPPPADKRNYDVEATIWHNDSIFMFTKDRTTPFAGKTFMYKIPATPGSHIAKLAGSMYLGSTIASARVTAADIHPASGRVALLVQERVILLKNYTGSNFFSGDRVDIYFKQLPGQAEAILFENQNTLLMTEEGSGGTPGYLYRIDLPL